MGCGRDPSVKLGLLDWADDIRCAHPVVAESASRVTAVTRCGHEGPDLGERGARMCPSLIMRIMSGFGWFGLSSHDPEVSPFLNTAGAVDQALAYRFRGEPAEANLVIILADHGAERVSECLGRAGIG